MRSSNGYALKSAGGNLIVKGAHGLSLERLEALINDVVGGKPMAVVPLPHATTAKAAECAFGANARRGSVVMLIHAPADSDGPRGRARSTADPILSLSLSAVEVNPS